MKKVFSLALILLLTSVLTQAQTSWQKSDYKYYNFNNYTSVEAFLEVVDENSFDSSLLNAAIFYETNRQRQFYGATQFLYDNRLERCAQGHSEDMPRLNFFSHTSLVPGKTNMSDRMGKVGYSNLYMAENISWHDVSNRNYRDLAKSIVDSWMDSPGHRKNILNPTYNYLGVGTAIFWSEYGLYLKSTQNFVE